MAERATIFQNVQVGVESVYGTGVAAGKLLQALSIQPGIKADVATFAPMGQKFKTLAALGKEWVEAKLQGPATYNEIVYPLSSALAYAAPTASGSAYIWTLFPSNSAADTVKSFTVEQGSAERAHKFSGGIVTALGCKYDRSGVELSGTMLGMALQDAITMTATPTAIAVVPCLPTQVSVKLADTAAGLAGATALARPISCAWELADRYAPLWVLNGSTSFSVTVENAPKLTAKLKVEADAEGMGLLTTLRSGATKFARIAAMGALISGSDYYTFQTDLALKVVDVSEFSDEQGVFAIEWSFEGCYDPTWGKAIQVLVKNTVATL